MRQRLCLSAGIFLIWPASSPEVLPTSANHAACCCPRRQLWIYRRLPSVFLPLSGRRANNVSCVFAALPGCHVWTYGGKRPRRSADVNNIMGPIFHITLTSHGTTVNLSGKWKHLIPRDGVIVMLQQENPGTICWQSGVSYNLDVLIGVCFLIISDHLLSLDY